MRRNLMIERDTQGSNQLILLGFFRTKTTCTSCKFALNKIVITVVHCYYNTVITILFRANLQDVCCFRSEKNTWPLNFSCTVLILLFFLEIGKSLVIMYPVHLVLEKPLLFKEETAIFCYVLVCEPKANVLCGNVKLDRSNQSA